MTSNSFFRVFLRIFVLNSKDLTLFRFGISRLMEHVYNEIKEHPRFGWRTLSLNKYAAYAVAMFGFNLEYL